MQNLKNDVMKYKALNKQYRLQCCPVQSVLRDRLLDGGRLRDNWTGPLERECDTSRALLLFSLCKTGEPNVPKIREPLLGFSTNTVVNCHLHLAGSLCGTNPTLFP